MFTAESNKANPQALRKKKKKKKKKNPNQPFTTSRQLTQYETTKAWTWGKST
jgi:hypothetical protein